ncbi:mhkC, partial [Symbiodinium sp. CCMP2456]
SCTYNISFEQASILPDTTGTIKELVAFWYNFTYIEIPPALSYITRNDSAITSTSVQYNILWDKRTQMNCTASPKDPAVCAEKAQTAVLSPTSDLRCLSHNSTNDLIQELDVVLSFTIEGLYPGVEYFVVCAGWIPGQFWVPTVDIEDHWSTQQTFTTLADTETGITSFQLTVYAVCSDGSIKQIYTSALRTSEFELGYTAQIDHWIAACQPGISLQLSESVDFIYQGDIVTASANAYVQWDAGPNITVTYTKPADATESAIVTAYLKFTVLALAWWEEQLSSNMAAHQVLGQIVDIGFSYPLFSASEVPGYPANADVSAPYMILSGGSSLPPLHNSTGVALPTGYEELVLDVGAKLNFNIKAVRWYSDDGRYADVSHIVLLMFRGMSATVTDVGFGMALVPSVYKMLHLHASPEKSKRVPDLSPSSQVSQTTFDWNDATWRSQQDDESPEEHH